MIFPPLSVILLSSLQMTWKCCSHDPNQVAFYPHFLASGPGRGNGTYQSTPKNVHASRREPGRDSNIWPVLLPRKESGFSSFPKHQAHKKFFQTWILIPTVEAFQTYDSCLRLASSGLFFLNFTWLTNWWKLLALFFFSIPSFNLTVLLPRWAHAR